MPRATRREERIRLAAALGALAAATLAGAQPSIDLTGVVRDFRKSHADFDKAAAPEGHYANNVAAALGPGMTPVYTGLGYRVATQWRDYSGRNIAPNLFGTSTGPCMGPPIGVMTENDFRIGNKSKVYGFDYPSSSFIFAVMNTNATDTCTVINDSYFYGDIFVRPGLDPMSPTVINLSPNSSIEGVRANLPAAVPSVVVAAPTGLGPSTGALTFSSGTSEISTNLHLDSLTITTSAIVNIKAGTHVTILVENDVIVNANSGPVEPTTNEPLAGLYVGAGASLDLYVKGDMVVSSRVQAYDYDPSRIRIFMLGTDLKTLDVQGNVPGRVRAQVFAPNTSLEMTQGSYFHGTFWGNQIDLENRCHVFIDMGLQRGDIDFAGVAGAAGGSITSAATFAQWFTDVPGENLSTPHTITLINNGAGVYEYLDDLFYPIDGDLFGNEGDWRNYNFTYAIDATFDYTPCGGQFVEFRGADDFWLFIDDALVMDLGGIRPLAVQYLSLDRLGLAAGEHQFKLCYAQRKPSSASWRLRTNLVLAQPAAAVSVSEPVD